MAAKAKPLDYSVMARVRGDIFEFLLRMAVMGGASLKRQYSNGDSQQIIRLDLKHGIVSSPDTPASQECAEMDSRFWCHSQTRRLS
jgi:hypothetical protein